MGSFTALTITKMGCTKVTLFDEDGVSPVNIPNQFYRRQDALQEAFKVDALADIVGQFTDATVEANNRHYVDQPLAETVIVATDSMSSRRTVWEQFLKQPQCLNLIEARMGAEVGMVYMIRKRPSVAPLTNGIISQDDTEFYEEMLYSDDKVKPLPCTARTIIYNVLMLASLICRAYKAIINEESFPREMIFNMTQIDKASFMVRK